MIDLDKVSLMGEIDSCRRGWRASEAKVKELGAELKEAIQSMDRAKAAMWDSYYGKGLTVEYARNVTTELIKAMHGAEKAINLKVIP